MYQEKGWGVGHKGEERAFLTLHFPYSPGNSRSLFACISSILSRLFSSMFIQYSSDYPKICLKLIFSPLKGMCICTPVRWIYGCEFMCVHMHVKVRCQHQVFPSTREDLLLSPGSCQLDQGDVINSFPWEDKLTPSRGPVSNPCVIPSQFTVIRNH